MSCNCAKYLGKSEIKTNIFKKDFSRNKQCKQAKQVVLAQVRLTLTRHYKNIGKL